MDIISAFKTKAKERKLRLVLPEGKDPRIIQAARIITDQKIAEVIIIGKQAQIDAAKELAQSTTGSPISLVGIKTIEPRQSKNLEDYAKKYVGNRDDISVPVAKRMVAKDLFYGGMMVATGDADAMVAGAATATATVIQAGALTIGYAPGINTASSFFLMIIPNFQSETCKPCENKVLSEKNKPDEDNNKPFIFADCAVNIDPTAQELAEIAIASANSAAKLLVDDVRVAMLSFSTKGSASHADVDKVLEALKIAKQRRSDLFIDGEFQADSAIIPQVAAKKVKDASDVAGRANVLIFPDLNSGNICYKLTQYLAGAQAIGPFLQGFAKPISDLSRGASVDDIVSTSAITLAQV